MPEPRESSVFRVFFRIPMRMNISRIRITAMLQGDWGSVPGWDTPKTEKLYPSFLNTQHYKVMTKDKGEQSRETSSAFLYNSV